jgi:hypothetical protein
MGEALLDRVISMFSGDTEPDEDKRILLRMIVRDLTQNRFSGFYRIKTEEAGPEFAECMYEMYRQIYPLREFLSRPEHNFLLKRLCAENFMDSQMAEAARRLSPETIERQKKSTTPPQADGIWTLRNESTDTENFIRGEGLILRDSAAVIKVLNPRPIPYENNIPRDSTAPLLISGLRQDLAFLESSFYESPRRLAADNCYKLILLLRGFAHFNFFSLLQKFDPLFRDGPHEGTPRFKPVKMEYIVEDIGEFLALSMPLNRGDDWKTALGIINATSNISGGANRMTEPQPAGGNRDIIAPEQWDTLLIKIRDLHQSKILSLMVQRSLRNPVWECTPKNTEEQTEKSWFDITKFRVQEIIDQIAGSLQNNRIETLAGEIFGSVDITRLRHYNRDVDEIFKRKNLGGYTYEGALNYLLAFIQDYLDKEIRDLCDLLLIRGQWTNIDASRETSEAMFHLSGMAVELTAFDEALSEDGKLGSRLKTNLSRIDREAFRANQIRSILNGVNAQALEMINTANLSLTIVEKHMKNLLADYRQKNHELVTNWKHLESYSKTDLGQRINEADTLVSKLIQLLKLYIRI